MKCRLKAREVKAGGGRSRPGRRVASTSRSPPLDLQSLVQDLQRQQKDLQRQLQHLQRWLAAAEEDAAEHRREAATEAATLLGREDRPVAGQPPEPSGRTRNGSVRACAGAFARACSRHVSCMPTPLATQAPDELGLKATLQWERPCGDVGLDTALEGKEPGCGSGCRDRSGTEGTTEGQPTQGREWCFIGQGSRLSSKQAWRFSPAPRGYVHSKLRSNGCNI